jgi:hypothetical protein
MSISVLREQGANDLAKVHEITVLKKVRYFVIGKFGANDCMPPFWRTVERNNQRALRRMFQSMVAYTI